MKSTNHKVVYRKGIETITDRTDIIFFSKFS